jgi:aarF domain-containing kinase
VRNVAFLNHDEADGRVSSRSIATTTYLLAWVKAIFPEFEFTWLGEEMRQNLPLEMDFNHEANNAARATADFAHHRKTSLYIPKVLKASKRTLIMEFIEGGRVDDLEYLDAREYITKISLIRLS